MITALATPTADIVTSQVSGEKIITTTSNNLVHYSALTLSCVHVPSEPLPYLMETYWPDSNGRCKMDFVDLRQPLVKAYAGPFYPLLSRAGVEGGRHRGDPLGAVRIQIGFSGSTDAAAHWCSRWRRAATGFSDRRSRPGRQHRA
jgi:hypothetical protein